MKIAVMALTREGVKAAVKIQRAYPEGEVQLYLPEKLKWERANGENNTIYFTEPFQKIFGMLFHRYRSLICVMAAGIVVRTAAPYLKDKYDDPAVVVLDQKGEFAVSLISGHLGGANALALDVAGKIGAQAVITTATDVSNKPAVEMLARDYKLALEPRSNIKKINWALVHDIPVKVFVQEGIQFTPESFWQEGSFEGPYEIQGLNSLTQEEIEGEAVPDQPCLIISPALYSDIPLENLDWVLGRPQYIVLGVGCRRGISPEQLVQFIRQCFKEEGISPLCLKKIVSIELKSSEEGLLEAAGQLGVPLEFITAEQIKNLKTRVSWSAFVEEITGVGCVCEPAALLGAGREELLWKKKKYQGMTTAAAGAPYRWWE